MQVYCRVCKIELGKDNWWASRQDRKDYICKECGKADPQARKNSKLKRQYGIDLVEYYDMRVKQNGNCLICGEFTTTLFVDHNHDTNEVRGLLCHNCNVGLGHFKDNVLNLTKAIQYLVERGSYGQQSV